MKQRPIRLTAAALCAAGWLAATTASATPLPGAAPMSTRLVHFPALGGAEAREIMGVWRVPPGSGTFPAVIILHGSAGMDSRGPLHADDLARAGIASLELDMWGARGLSGGARRQVVHFFKERFGLAAQ